MGNHCSYILFIFNTSFKFCSLSPNLLVTTYVHNFIEKVGILNLLSVLNEYYCKNIFTRKYRIILLYTMIKNMLKRRKESDTYLTTFCRHCCPLQLMKATVLAESSNRFLFFHCHLCTPVMSTESSQIGVALFPSF